MDQYRMKCNTILQCERQAHALQLRKHVDEKNALAELTLRYLSHFRVDLCKLRAEVVGFLSEVLAGTHEVAQQVLSASLAHHAATNQAISKDRHALNEHPHLCHHQQKIRGNIRVFCRVRPPAIGAIATPSLEYPEPNQIAVIDPKTCSKKIFEFDQVFGPDADQQSVFEAIQPLVQSVIDGHCVCILAYGQTGAGKTYTMEGTEDNPGIATRALEELFMCIAEQTGAIEYHVAMSVLELYNEKIRDLLAGDEYDREFDGSVHQNSGLSPVHALPNNCAAKYEIKHGPAGVYVSDLLEVPVRSAEEALHVLDRCQLHRTISTTDINARSSRSHVIVKVVVRAHTAMTTTTSGKLVMVDLAGSERISKSLRQATAVRIKEVQSINRSLSALGDVIAALGRVSSLPLSSPRRRHVPFRNSKLTYLLQDSLGADSEVVLFVHLSPDCHDIGETICSLHFSHRAIGSPKLE